MNKKALEILDNSSGLLSNGEEDPWNQLVPFLHWKINLLPGEEFMKVINLPLNKLEELFILA